VLGGKIKQRKQSCNLEIREERENKMVAVDLKNLKVLRLTCIFASSGQPAALLYICVPKFRYSDLILVLVSNK